MESQQTFHSKERFSSRYGVTEQVEASTVKLSLDQNSLASLKSCLPIKNFSSCIVYRPEYHSAIRAVYNQTERWVL